MKFFTLEVYHSWYSSNYEDDSILAAASREYLRYLEGLQGILPAHILRLALLRGVDDGLVVEVKHDRTQRVLVLTLRCGDLQMGYYDLILRYEEAELTLEDEQTLARIARTTEELYGYEVDQTEDGRIEHRLLFHPGVWFAIRCRALHWNKIDRPNRKLPRRKERFPDGPFTTP